MRKIDRPVGRNTAKSCYINVGRRRIEALVDTGADTSLIDKSIADLLPTGKCHSIGGRVPNLHGVTGHSLSVTGRCTIQFMLGSRSLSHDFVVVKNLSREIILGVDFLERFGVKLDYSQKTMAIENSMVLLKDKSVFRPEQVYSTIVRAKQRQELLPHTNNVITVVNIKSIPAGHYVISPLDNSALLNDQPGLLAPVVVVNHKGGINAMHLMISNTTNRSFVVRRGTRLGVAENIAPNEISPVEDIVTTVGGPPEDTGVDLSRARVGNIDSGNLAQLHRLLGKYRAQFVEKDIHLGKTNLVKAKFDTGDAPPIKLPPYRIPFFKRKIVDEHVQEMLDADIIRPSNSPFSFPVVLVG